MAANPAAGKIYWANWSPGEIRVANLDGSGERLDRHPEAGNVCGVAVDPANGKIYWANFSTSEIRVGNLDGTGTPSILFTDPPNSGPSGVAIDPANNKIYWTNQFADEVRVGNLDGSGFASTLLGPGGQPDRGRGQPRGRQDLLDRPQRRHGPGRAPGGRYRPRRLHPVQQLLAERASDRPHDEQDLLGRLVVRLGDPGREPGRHRRRLAPVQRRGRLALHRGAEEAREHRASEYLRRGQDRQGAHLRERDVGARPARGVPVQGPGQLRRLSVEEWNGSPIATGPTFKPNLAGDYTCTLTATNEAGSTPSQTSSVKKVKAK